MARGRAIDPQVLRRLYAEQLPESGTLVIAISGGADSVFLARSVTQHWMELRPKKRHIVLAHINHQLRGAASTRDAQFVRALAKELSLPVVIKRVRKVARKNLEAEARRVRYEALEQVRRLHRATWVLTAHTANDVAETFLLALLHNRDSTLLVARDLRRRLIRPISKLMRSQIEGYLMSQVGKRSSSTSQQQWCVDQSNSDLSFERNWVRHQLIPMLEARCGIGLTRTLAERAVVMHADRHTIEQALVARIQSLPSKERLNQKVLVRVLKTLEDDTQRDELMVHLLRREFKLNVGRMVGNAVAKLILAANKVDPSEGDSCLQLPGGGTLKLVRDRLCYEGSAMRASGYKRMRFERKP